MDSLEYLKDLLYMENLAVFFRLLIITVLEFAWFWGLKDKKRKVFYFFLILFIYIYNGLGLAYDSKDNSLYEVHYYGFMGLLSLSMYFFTKKEVKIQTTENLFDFCQRYSIVIITIYFCFLLYPLVQNGHLLRLINPPSTNLVDSFEKIDFSKNLVSNYIASIKTFLTPLFWIALYRYVKKPFVVIFLYLMTHYIPYCDIAYISRGEMAFTAVFIVIYLSIFYPSLRKKIIFGMLIIIPQIIIFFAEYVNIRLGQASENLDFGDSVTFLIKSETNYYSWFELVHKADVHYALNYLVWLITLPLPGFLKPFDLDFNFTALYTVYILDLPSSEDITSIALPGLVPESVFIFGNYWFFVHPLIFGWVFTMTYNTFSQDRRTFFAFLYMIMTICFLSGRGGTPGCYSGAIKYLFVVFLFSLFDKKKKVS